MVEAKKCTKFVWGNNWLARPRR